MSVQHRPGTELLCSVPPVSCGRAAPTRGLWSSVYLQAVKNLFFLLFAAGWWLVENADKQIAWFPASYLEEIDVHKDIQNALTSNEEGKYPSDPWDTTFYLQKNEF